MRCCGDEKWKFIISKREACIEYTSPVFYTSSCSSVTIGAVEHGRLGSTGGSMHCNVYRVKLLDRCTPHNNNNKMNQTGLKSGYRWIWRHSIIACKFSRYPLFALYFRTCSLLVAEAEIEFGVDRWGAVYLHLERIKHNFSSVSSVTFFSLGIADWGGGVVSSKWC